MTNLKHELEKKILELPDVTIKTYQGKNSEFSSFVYKDKEFAHFHNENELDLRLTKRVIADEGVSHPDDSEHHPKRSKASPWVELRYKNKKELTRVFGYVKLAIAQIK